MPHDKPNVLLFTTDQHRGDHLSIAGHPVIETPNFDAIVNRGAYFPNAYSEIPSTTGARRCLHGGQGSYDCGLIGYSGTEWHEPNTLAQVLADGGYHCMNVGFRNMHPTRKLYGFHWVVPHDLGLGADEYREWLERELGPEIHERGHAVDANGWLARPWDLEERYHPTRWTTDVVLEMLGKRDPTRPFFIWCSHLRPHSPYDPPEFFWDMYINREMPPVPVGDWAAKHDIPNPGLERTAWHGRLTPVQLQRMRAGYMGSISYIDYEFGRLMEEFRRYVSGEELNNTLIIFTADHGDMQGDHNLMRKTYAYEGSARIPFMVRYPASLDLPTGAFDEVVGLQDVMPTILEAAGIEVPDSVTGKSVLGAIRREPWREFLHGEHSPCYSADEAVQFVTDGSEKYLWFPVTGKEQFFDMRRDRDELHNVVKDPAYADRVALWRGRLIERLGKRGDGFSDGEKLLIREPYGPMAEKPDASES